MGDRLRLEADRGGRVRGTGAIDSERSVGQLNGTTAVQRLLSFDLPNSTP